MAAAVMAASCMAGGCGKKAASVERISGEERNHDGGSGCAGTGIRDGCRGSAGVRI